MKGSKSQTDKNFPIKIKKLNIYYDDIFDRDN